MGARVLKARVRAAPTEGEANAALGQADRRGARRPPRAVESPAGATARLKRLAIDGDAPTLIARLEKLRAPR